MTISGEIPKIQNPKPKQDDRETSYVLSKYRFVITLVYILAANMNILMWSIFSPLQTVLVNIYDESLTYISFGTILISKVTYVLATFFANYVIDTYGLRVGVIIGSSLGLCGLWIRCLSNYGFVWIFIGQCFAGIAQPYLDSTPQKVSNIWFGESERAYATTFMICAMSIGNMLGPIIPRWFINLDAENSTILSQLHNLLFWAAILGSGCFVLTFLGMKKEPRSPPSKAAAAEKHDFKKSFVTLLKDKNAMTMITCTAIVSGTVGNYGATMQQALLPFGFESNQAGDLLSMSTFVTLFGAALGAFIIQKFKRYRLLILGSSVISLTLLFFNLFAAKTGNFILLAIAMTIFAVSISPILPISLEFGVELAFPVGEATIGGMWFFITQFSSTIQSLIVDSILGSDPNTTSVASATWAFVFMIICQILTVIPLFFVEENLKRLKYEKNDDLLEDHS